VDDAEERRPVRVVAGGHADLDANRGSRIAATYVLAASVWIVAGGVAVDRLARRVELGLFELELVKGLAFVLVTGGFLWRALRRWSARMQRAAQVERLAAQRLLRAEEMRRTFLAGISHELRTPLTAVSGYAATLEARGEALDATRRRELATRLGASARRLEHLVLDLLEVDRLMRGLGHLRLEEADVTALVRRVVAATEVGARMVTIDGDEARAEVDVPKVERLVEHLLSNTARHTPPGTSVTVHVACAPATVRIAVADDGPGFASEVLEAALLPFAQDTAAAASPSPGIGLGLTLVAEIAALHGGAASCANQPDGGACVTVTLPRSPSPA
jgi:signal transduction histidine kinase